MPNRVDLDKELLFELYRRQKLSTYKIAQKLGYSQLCIYNNLLRYNIHIIPNSERYKGKHGHPHTEESRRKMSIAKLGDRNPMKRLDVRIKVSKANKGRKFSSEVRQRMSKAQKGRVVTWGVNISMAKKKWYMSKDGREFIKKLRQRKGSNNPMFNKSEEIRKRHWTKLWDQHKKEQIISTFRENRIKQRFPLKFSKIEKIIGNELKRRNIDFFAHHPILKICQPDVVIPSYKLAIQCDGDWWHANKKFYNHNFLNRIQKNNVKRDKYQDSVLREKGWHVMRFWEFDIKKDVSKCVDRIEEFLKQKKGDIT